jgi:hypothetical protein
VMIMEGSLVGELVLGNEKLDGVDVQWRMYGIDSEVVVNLMSTSSLPWLADSLVVTVVTLSSHHDVD